MPIQLVVLVIHRLQCQPSVSAYTNRLTLNRTEKYDTTVFLRARQR